jgi:membrane-associated phospholipid phosphatase
MATSYNPGPDTHHDQQQRREDAYRLRHAAALANKNAPLPTQRSNGDEERYPSHIGNFSKTLPHTPLGEVVPAAYEALLHALRTGRPQDLEQIPMGSTAGKLTDPQGGVTFSLAGADAQDFALPPAPTFASPEMAAEMVELYWMALTRDIHFDTYDSHDGIDQACADLSRLSDFRAPKVNGQVVPAVLFRGTSPGELRGPYISQFLLLPIPYGMFTIEQRLEVPTAKDFMTHYSEWLRIQDGAPPASTETLVPQAEPRYIRNGRDLARYVHRDFSYQPYLNAALMLLGWRTPLRPHFLTGSKTRAPFCNHGGPMILDWVARAGLAALNAAWYSKWQVHRRVRPEAYSGSVHNHLEQKTRYPLHRDLLESAAVAAVQRQYGSALLPMAYPEGSPSHPAYPAGHATIAGACVTVLKALFDDTANVPQAKEVNREGTALEDYPGTALTVEGELNKLATNIAYGRNIAGVHWRTDGNDGLLLGEQVAVHLIHDLLRTLPERPDPLQFRSFRGDSLTVSV